MSKIGMPELPKEVKFFLVFKDGSREEIVVSANRQVWPIALFQDTIERYSCYPLFDGNVHNNLYGRMMTLLEAVIENPIRLKAVKDLMSKELNAWSEEVHSSAVEVGHGGDSNSNVYTR